MLLIFQTPTEEAAANIASRMAAVPTVYRRLSATMLDAAQKGRPPARLQVDEVARQCAAWAGPGNAFYPGLVGRLTGVPDSLRGELDAAARAATAATAGLGAFLRRELLPLARAGIAFSLKDFHSWALAPAAWAWTRYARPWPGSEDTRQRSANTGVIGGYPDGQSRHCPEVDSDGPR